MLRRLAFLCLAALAACSSDEEPQRPYHRGDAAYDSPPAPTPPPAAPVGPDPALLAKLEPIAASANADGAAFGLTFTAADFIGSYEHRRKEFSAPFPSYDAKIAALPEPEIVDFLPGEFEKGARARWTDAAGTQYGDYLPRDGSAVTEAWTRVYGFRDLSVTGMIITQTGVPATKWRRILWQPNKKRWSHFTEDQDRALLTALVNGKLSQPDPSDKNSARFECERLQLGVERARAAGQPVEGYQRHMKGVIERSYDRELKLLAAQSLLE